MGKAEVSGKAALRLADLRTARSTNSGFLFPVLLPCLKAGSVVFMWLHSEFNVGVER